MTVLDRLRAAPGWVDGHLAPLRSSLPYRAYTRYSAARGNVLAGGIAYFAFFSIFPALAIGFTVFAIVLGNQEDLQARLVQNINETFGTTLISYHQGQQGVVTIDQLIHPDVLTTSGLIGVVTLILAGLGWIGALRDGVQAVFGSRQTTNVVVLKLSELLLLGVSGLAILASVVVSVAVNVAGDQVLRLLGLSHGEVGRPAVNVVGQLALVLVDTLLFTLMFARLNGAGVPLRDVLGGGILAAIGFSGMKIFGSELLKGASHSRFLATFGVVVGLLIWMNIAARLVLVAAAWSATVAYDRGHLRTPEPVELRRARSAARDGAGVAQAVPTGEPVEEQPARTAERSRRRSPLLLVLAFAAAALARRSVRTRRRISDRPAPSAGNAPGAVLPDGSRESPSPVSPAGGRQPRRRER